MGKQTLYTWKSAETFIERMIECKRYEAVQLHEGSLGIGDWVLIPPDENQYHFVIREVPVSSVYSGQTIRRCRALSKKVQKELEDARKGGED